MQCVSDGKLRENFGIRKDVVERIRGTVFTSLAPGPLCVDATAVFGAAGKDPVPGWTIKARGVKLQHLTKIKISIIFVCVWMLELLGSTVARSGFVPFRGRVGLPFKVCGHGEAGRLMGRSIVKVGLATYPPPFTVAASGMSTTIASLSLV